MITILNNPLLYRCFTINQGDGAFRKFSGTSLKTSHNYKVYVEIEIIPVQVK